MPNETWLAATQKPDRYDRCDQCSDAWHGLPCPRHGCNCNSSFIDKDGAA